MEKNHSWLPTRDNVPRLLVMSEERFDRMVAELMQMEFSPEDEQIQKWFQANARQIVSLILKS